MAEERSKLFSESWHRVGGYSVQLRPEIEIHRQRYRGELWHVLQDPYTNRFFRLRRGAYRFVARLRAGVTVEQVWQECLLQDADEAPGQDEVIGLIGQLYQANLIVSNLPPDSAQIFERKRKREEKEWKGRWQSFLCPKFTLANPDPWLKALAEKLGPWLVGAGGLIWLVVVLWGARTALGNWGDLMSSAAGLFEPGNWVPILLVLVLTKAVHEFGHGLICRCYGGQVPKFGVVLMFFTLPPITLPFMDTTSSYGFSSKWRRLMVAGGGMIFEFFLAALACIVWAQLGDGMGKRMLHNIMVVSTVTTLLMNINPLLKFDGYYILSDWLDLPNLQSRAHAQLLYLYESRLLKLPNTVNPAHGMREAWWLAVYGVLAFLYKLVLIYALINLVAGSYFGFGYVLAAVLFILWVVMPVGKGLGYLMNSPKLFRRRSRAMAMTGAVVAVFLGLIMLLPLPRSFKASGVLLAAERDDVFGGVDGYVVEMVAASGTEVKKGQVLLRLSNREIGERVLEREAEIRRLTVQRDLLQSQDFFRLPAVQQSLSASRQALEYWEKQGEALLVRAPRDGIWVADESDHLGGRLLIRGMRMGEVFCPERYVFHAVIPQEEASHLFNQRIVSGEVRLKGNAELGWKVERFRFIPAEQEKLPSAALGWKGGGELEVDPQDPEGLKAKRSFYSVQAELERGSEGMLRHRRSGYIKFDLPWEPVFWQVLRGFRQMLQQKHSI
ncbi:MAG: hypothetical protein HC904_11290 [Blastochloris sp.]|nr:hypothetical protein [Blastochloris sp.]